MKVRFRGGEGDSRVGGGVVMRSFAWASCGFSSGDGV